MAFEIVEPRFAGRRRLIPGKASINSAGNLMILTSDLRRGSIARTATLMVDKTTRRIAVRAPKELEPVYNVNFNKTKTTGRINIGSAITALGATSKAARGEYDLIQKDDLFYIVLK